MSKPLPRRAVLKALAAAPLVAEQLAQSEIGAAIGKGAAVTAENALIAPTPFDIGPKGAEILALSKSGLMPDWFKRSLAQAARGHYGYTTIEPDVACLRSLSLGAKLRVSAQRRLDAALDNMERDIIDQQLRAKFMGWNR